MPGKKLKRIDKNVASPLNPEGFVLGAGIKLFTIAGLGIVCGVRVSFVYGMAYWLSMIIG